MNISLSAVATSATNYPNVQHSAEASEGTRMDRDQDADDQGLKSSAVAQPFIAKPTATMGNHVNTAA